MCRPHALAATALLLALMAGQAQAWPFGRREAKPDPAVAAAEAAAATPARTRGVTNTGETEEPDAPRTPPKPATPAERAAAGRLPILAQAAFWSGEFELNPADAEAGVKLATVLRQLGQTDAAGETAQQVLALRPDDVGALYEFARARLAVGQGFYAIEPLRRIAQLRPDDWRPHSLLGVALEQAQRLPEARRAWEDALRLSPENPSVLTNLGLSYMAEGNGDEAERVLRRAAARPDADIRVRQNLALVLGLRGRTAEAEQMLRQDLPPEMVNENLAWLRARTGAGPRTWGSVTSAE